ncbi:MAG: hypothetical protein JOZ25_05375 [Actinobacteria bacterium]|nr:hypothetical protein [Actinomycetota bacterium]
MSSRLFWRVAAVQVLLTGVLFAVLAVAVPHHFFVTWGIVVGPLIWIACSLVTGRIVGLPLLFTVFCAAAGGVAGTLVGLVAGHPVGIVAGVAVFAACASGYGQRPTDEPRPPTDPRAPDVART